ncbi:MAG: hypothetical protein QM831_32365 [Kofleriaceae bacterium]
MLGDETKPPAERLHATVRAFFHSECAEAPLRLALADAAASYRDSPEAQHHRETGTDMAMRFIGTIAPHASKSQRAFAVELLFATMSALGKEVSERGLSPKEVDRWAAATSDMVYGYIANH